TVAATVAPTSFPSTTVALTLPPAVAYTDTAGPAVPNQTDPIDAAWVSTSGALTGVADGTYWASAAGVGQGKQTFITFRFVQAFFGDACTKHFAGVENSCDNDLGTQEDPHGTMAMIVGTAKVTVADAATQKSYLIDGSELARLLAGKTPNAAAPADYTYVPFSFLVKVGGGQIVSAEQVWTP
ncbi:MAG: hypothetical protein ABIQ39_11195, partial [Ilumatobacteraceae bacterium]